MDLQTLDQPDWNTWITAIYEATGTDISASNVGITIGRHTPIMIIPNGVDLARKDIFLTGKRRDSRWVFDLIRSSDPNGARLLDQTIDGINKAVEERDYDYLDRILMAVPVTTASRHLLLALARSTYAIRLKLPNWRPAISRIKTAFKTRGLDAEKLLDGLI